MAKLKTKVPSPGQARDKEAKDKGIKEVKATKVKDKNNLVGRVKKVIKKSRRRLTEEKFEKELQRTIEFLAQLRTKLDTSDISGQGAQDKGISEIETKQSQRGGGTKTDKKDSRTAQKKSRPAKKGLEDGAVVDKKRKSLKVEEKAPVAEPASTLQTRGSQR